MNKMVHLHVHSDFSTLDGLGKPEQYAKRASELGQPALALTDHGETSGLYDLQKACDEYGIKPILGSEFYFFDERAERRGHLVVLAKNNNGLKNIYKMQEKAYTELFYYKPRIDMDTLREHCTDIIVTSACLANQIPQAIVNGDLELAKEFALEFKEILGENFYLEIQSNQVFEQQIVNKELIKMSRELGIPLVATNDVHYPFKEDGEIKQAIAINKDGEEIEVDYSTHEVLLAIQVRANLTDENRFKFSEQDFWLKSREEMKDSFNKNLYTQQELESIDTALDNTLVIADLCNARIEKDNYLPHFHTIPKDKTEDQLLRELVTEKYKENIVNDGLHNKEFAEDVFKELDVITDEGYSGYFLIVQDYINKAREAGIVVGDGRGSGAGSKVAKVLDITRINPQDYNLLFERFLAHGRVPDFDTDFSDIDAVFDYLVSVYGKTNVARIQTFGTLAPKASVRRVFTAFGHSQKLMAKINGCMPDKPSFTLDEAYEHSEELRDYREKYPKEFKVVESLEGVISHKAQHAGGVVIWDRISDVLPITTQADDRDKLIVSFDMDTLEELGHFKFDILGLQTLEVIERALQNIEQTTGERIDLDKIDFEVPGVYRMLSKGDVSGVFQIEEQSTKVMQQQPKSFEDLIAINALIRPGIGDWNSYINRREGKEEFTIHPDRISYLKETEGIITYQEQYLLDCKVFAGWDIAFADKSVRKNKTIRQDTELRDKFIQDGINNNYEEDILSMIWEEIVEAVAGGYSFNKSHSTSYARLTYKTAWLKYKYPKEFYSALMTQNAKDQSKVSDLIAEVKARNIPILPPNINTSGSDFHVTEDGIRYQLSAISGIGDKAMKAIESLRPIENMQDLYSRSKRADVRSNVMINLIKAGVFDDENENRVQLINTFLDWIDKSDDRIPEGMWSATAKNIFEKEALGVYLSNHPMEQYGYAPLDNFKDGKVAIIGGEVIDVARIIDKNGNPMAFVEIDTQHGVVKCVVFSYIWNNKQMNTQEVMKVGNLIEVKGTRSGNDILPNQVQKLF